MTVTKRVKKTTVYVGTQQLLIFAFPHTRLQMLRSTALSYCKQDQIPVPFLHIFFFRDDAMIPIG
jgi:hypothetical protein